MSRKKENYARIEAIKIEKKTAHCFGRQDGF